MAPSTQIIVPMPPTSSRLISPGVTSAIATAMIPRCVARSLADSAYQGEGVLFILLRYPCGESH
jgi:hypothetical protein